MRVSSLQITRQIDHGRRESPLREGALHAWATGTAIRTASRATTRATTGTTRDAHVKGLVDQEGLPDTIPKFLSLLKKEGTLDRAFEERYSMVCFLLELYKHCRR